MRSSPGNYSQRCLFPDHINRVHVITLSVFRSDKKYPEESISKAEDRYSVYLLPGSNEYVT